MKVALRLFHGRTSPDQNLDDWGTDGPVLGPFDGFHMTYFSTLRLVNDGDTEIELNKVDDLIELDGVYYGDMVILSMELAQKNFPDELIWGSKLQWTWKVDELVKARLCLDHNDWIDSFPEDWAYWPPEAFVDWYKTKYNLDEKP